jgi:hypothetical protein
MERRKLIDENQKVTQTDFLDFGLFPQQTFDDIGEGLLIPDQAFWGFPTVANGTNLVTGGGSLITGGVIYVNDDSGGTTFDLLPRMPVATRKIVTVGVWGQEIDSDQEPRTFLIDATTRATEARVTSTERLRRAELSLVSGIEGPDPMPPALASNVLAVADVLLDTTGVVSVTMREENRAPNLRSLQIMAKAFDVWRLRISSLIDTLMTELAALAGRIRGLAPMSVVFPMMQQLAQVKDAVGLPETYTASGADYYLTEAGSDKTDADWLAMIEEGIRFPHALDRDMQLGALNTLDPNISIQDNFMLPKWDPSVRIDIPGKDGEIAIASIQYQTVDWVQKGRSRIRLRYGLPFVVCSNGAWWKSGQYDPVANIFYRAGDTFTVITTTYDIPGNPTHFIVRLAQFWYDTYEEYYWDRIVTNHSISGSILAQTFLNANEGWLVGVNLHITRKAAVGDLTVLITEVNDSGAPAYDKVLGYTTIAPAVMVLWPAPTFVSLVPIALKTGSRYAVVLMTAGNHYHATVTGNKFMGGSLFTSTDNAWAQGDLLSDLAIGMVFAKFRANRVEATLLPLQLENGIAAIDINADVALPQGTGFQLIFEVQIDGVWVPLAASSQDALLGLPAMLPFRAVFLGTQDMMPGLGVSSNSRALTWRPRSDFRHISDIRTMPVATTVNTVYVDLRLESWRGTPHHTCVVKLEYGTSYGSTATAGVITDLEAPDDPTALLRRCVFTFGTPISSYKIRIEGTTDNVLTPFLVSQRIDVALTI